MRYTIEVLRYTCPTCNAYAQIPANPTKEPYKCTVCGVVICNRCQKYMFCPHCSSVLSSKENTRFRKIERAIRNKSLKTLIVGAFSLVFAMVILGGIFMENVIWIIVGAVVLLGGIGFAVFSHLRTNKLQAGYRGELDALKPVMLERLNTITPPARKCSSCGTSMPLDSQFCNQCGTKF